MHPKSGFGRENRQFMARFARHASENGLPLARYARHASEMPRKSPSEDTPREDPARKGALFRCTGPSNHARCADLAVRRSAKPPECPQPRCRPSWQRTHSIHGASSSPPQTPHAPPPRDTEASGGRKILRRPEPRSAKAQLGGQRHRSTHVAIWPQHPQRRWRHQARCGP